MSRTTPPRSPRRSYGHFCGLGRALDRVGDRWAMLVVRELLGGPRRYTDLHADLPGASTDILAARLRDLEADGIVERRPLPAPASGQAYALTARGAELVPALTMLARWGAGELGERARTDAVRVHWHALPLRAALHAAGMSGTVDVITEDGRFHVHAGDRTGRPDRPIYGDGAAEPPAGCTLRTDVATLLALCRGELTVDELRRRGQLTVDGSR